MSLFSNFPCDYQDKVWLNINKQDLLFLYAHTEAHKAAHDFYAHICDSFDGQRAKVPYIVAFFGVKELLSACAKEYKQMESLANDLAIADSSANQGNEPPSATEEKAKLCFSDMHLLMSICVALEDQLWAMVQHSRVPAHLKHMWQQTTAARTHTAYGRMQSMGQVEDGADQLRLAELGLMNEWDSHSSFIHFQEPHVPIESIYDKNLVDSLQKQLPGNQHLNGQATWNVSYDQTLNAFPPENHDNALPKSVRTEQNVSAHGRVD